MDSRLATRPARCSRIALLASLSLACGLAACQSAEKSRWDYRTQGEVQMSGKNYAAAAEDFRKYLELEPGSYEVRYMYGLALMKLNRNSEAAEALLTAYSQRPGRSDYADAMAEAMVAAGKKDELFRILRSNANDRNTVEDWLRLGNASLAMGDIDTAQTALLTAARVDKGLTPEPQIALSDLYKALGRDADAEKRIRMAYYRGPYNSTVIQRSRAMGLRLNPGDGIFPEESEPQG